MHRTLQRSDDGDRIELGPNEVVIRLSADDTGGDFSLLEYTAAPDGPSPAPHLHEETHEVFYVLDGDLAWTIEDERATASAGDTVWIPPGTPHTFEADRSRPARFLVWFSPGGFEGYFEEMGEFLESLPPGPPDMERVQAKVVELCEVYDQTIVDPDP